MRKKPFKICAKAGCDEKTKGRFCNQHKKLQWSGFDAKRENSNQRGYDYDWRKFRDWFLTEHPLCLFCLDDGLVNDATEVDHIKPLAEFPELKYHADNCRALCKRCHSVRTWHEQSIGANKCQESEKAPLF